MMKRIKLVIALIGLIVSVASCDDGTEMEKSYSPPFDGIDMLILDKNGNNVLDRNIEKQNPAVKYDPNMMVIFQGDTLVEDGWNHLPEYFATQEPGTSWYMEYCTRPGVTSGGVMDFNPRNNVNVLFIGSVMMYYNKSYEFDVVSKLNNYSWHIKVEYETHSTAQKRDFNIRRMWIDGKSMPEKVVVFYGYDSETVNNIVYVPFDITLTMNK